MATASAALAGDGTTEGKRWVAYDTEPSRYAHWKLSFDGPVATVALGVDEDRGLMPGYKL